MVGDKAAYHVVKIDEGAMEGIRSSDLGICGWKKREDALVHSDDIDFTVLQSMTEDDTADTT